MAGLVDHEAVMAEFEDFLVSDGRSSHGTDFLTRKLAELRAKHRIDESAEAALLRRFGAHLTDSFMGILPDPATNDPLAAGDPSGTPAAMDGGADIPSPPQREVPCQTPPQRRHGRSPRAPVSGRDARSQGLAGAAAT